MFGKEEEGFVEELSSGNIVKGSGRTSAIDGCSTDGEGKKGDSSKNVTSTEVM
jgi:hypothetical protein